jgi:hypothetical protein
MRGVKRYAPTTALALVWTVAGEVFLQAKKAALFCIAALHLPNGRAL